MAELNHLERILGTNPGTSERLDSLQAFNTYHADTQIFSNLYSTELKKQVIENLCLVFNEIPPKISTDELTATLCTFRLLCREDDGAESFLTPKYLEIVCNIALDKNSTTSLYLKIEAAKCLVNMIFKSPKMATTMEQMDAHFKILDILDMDIPNSFAFPHLRTLFLLSRPVNDSRLYRQLADKGAIAKLYGMLKKLVDEEPQPNPSNFQVIREILQILFNLTIGMGSLNSKTEELMDYQTYVPNYEEVVTTLLRIFGFPLLDPQADPAVYDLKNCVINCFVNIPLQFFSILVVLGDRDLTLKSLFDMLEWEVRSDEGREKKGLVTIFMVVRSLLASAPDVRPYAMNRLFPGRDIERERTLSEEKGEAVNMDAFDKDADTVGNKIIKYMTSMSMAIKYVSNELLFSLVGESADDLIRLTGFGNAAGLLAMRDLYGMGKHLNRDTLDDMKTAQKAEKTQKPLPDLRSPREGETKEEKEQRTKENLSKMIESGMIQVIKKDK